MESNVHKGMYERFGWSSYTANRSPQLCMAFDYVKDHEIITPVPNNPLRLDVGNVLVLKCLSVRLLC